MQSSMRCAVALVIWSTPALVFGCSCVDWAARGACPLMKDAKEVIFSGTVLSAENPPESSTIEGQVGEARYTFRVEEPFSSGVPNQVDVYSGRGGADCSVHFRIGEKYLVDGWRGSTGSISASICSKTRFFRDSDPLLAELRFIRDGKKPDSLFGVLRRTQEPWGGASDPAYNQPLGDSAITLRLGVQEFHAKSGVDGRYSFRDLPPGEYTVWADLPPKLVLGEYILDRPVPSLVVVADACGEYDIKALPPGRISGQVRARDGTGVSGWGATDIQLFRADRYTETPKGWDDSGWSNFPKEGGYFFFDHVAPGDYILVYNPTNTTGGERRKFPRTFYPSSPDLDHASRIHVGEGESVTGIVVHVVAKTPSQ
jgi:hypothetical protein